MEWRGWRGENALGPVQWCVLSTSPSILKSRIMRLFNGKTHFTSIHAVVYCPEGLSPVELLEMFRYCRKSSSGGWNQADFSRATKMVFGTPKLQRPRQHLLKIISAALKTEFLEFHRLSWNSLNDDVVCCRQECGTGRARKVQLQHRQIAFPESNCCETETPLRHLIPGLRCFVSCILPGILFTWGNDISLFSSHKTRLWFATESVDQ